VVNVTALPVVELNVDCVTGLTVVPLDVEYPVTVVWLDVVGYSM
jgi:hypothetical protein